MKLSKCILNLMKEGRDPVATDLQICIVNLWIIPGPNTVVSITEYS